MLTYGSLFTGIGGLDLAVESVFGAQPAWQVEINPYCRKVLAKHWPNVFRYVDVCKFCKVNEPRKVDIICGGFPCQDVSGANPKGQGLAGKRSGLWREFVRIIRHVRPRYVVVENVTSGLALWGSRVVGHLAALGYDAEWESVHAAHAGAPHLRERTFILGHANRDSQSIVPVNAKASGLPSASEYMRRRWSSPPARVRMDDGLSHGLDRLHALGNAVCPQQAELAIRRMLTRI